LSGRDGSGNRARVIAGDGEANSEVCEVEIAATKKLAQ
jgi:hypothetical protein